MSDPYELARLAYDAFADAIYKDKDFPIPFDQHGPEVKTAWSMAAGTIAKAVIEATQADMWQQHPKEMAIIRERSRVTLEREALAKLEEGT